jgi:hypothetical protein
MLPDKASILNAKGYLDSEDGTPSKTCIPPRHRLLAVFHEDFRRVRAINASSLTCSAAVKTLT